MHIIIQKFGGSSLASRKNREKAVAHVLEARERGYSPIVVVSAMGRKGDGYATDTLIEMARDTCEEPQERTLSFLISCGENISAALLSLHLQKRGCPSLPMSGGMAGIITTDSHVDALIETIKKDLLLKAINEHYVPVVAGFQGINKAGEVTTLGRGGSDTTAVALGAALQAKEVEIYTDVSGLMTADPRIVPEARQINKVSYSEVMQMSQDGAKVIHPRAVEIAMDFNVPVVIKSTHEKKETGTLIANHQQSFSGEIQKRNVASCITHLTDLAQITVTTDSVELEEQIFTILAKEKISIDLINIFPDKKVFTVPQDKAEMSKRVLKKLAIPVDLETGLAKITVIGAGMRGVPGVLSKIVTALKEKRIPILQTADSHINISCLIAEEHVEKAVCSLHSAFGLERRV